MSPAASDGALLPASGFPPVAGRGARVLVLGSLPSRQSLALRQYYGNPQNAFWRIMGDLFGAGPDLPYAERSARLVHSGVALWDVLQSSIRPGSLDAAIQLESARANDFAAFFADNPEIATVFFNGRKAAELYARLVAAEGSGNIEALRCMTLPSTSPAHAALPYEEKLRRWSVIRAAVGDNRRS